MIPSEDVVSIHNLLIEKFGGLKGIRDKNALDLMAFEQKKISDSIRSQAVQSLHRSKK